MSLESLSMVCGPQDQKYSPQGRFSIVGPPPARLSILRRRPFEGGVIILFRLGLGGGGWVGGNMN